MGWDSSTQVLTKPFTKIAANGQGDLQLALGRTTCKSHIQLICDVDANNKRLESVNVFSKYKGVKAPVVSLAAQTQQVTVYNAGLETVHATTQAAFITEVRKAINTNASLSADYMYKGQWLMCKVARPDPANGYPARAYDYDGYKANATLRYVVPSAQSASIDLGPGTTWIPDDKIDLTSGTATQVQDQTLEDLSQGMQRYYQLYANDSSIASRDFLHVYDLIHYQGLSMQSVTNIKRGVMMFPGDSSQTPLVAITTIPWRSGQGTSNDFYNTMLSPHGQPVVVVEFLCIPNQFYIAIPTFAYNATGYSRWNFANTVVEENNRALRVLFNYDTDFTLFGWLYLQIEYSSNNSTWYGFSSSVRTIAREHEAVIADLPAAPGQYDFDNEVLHTILSGETYYYRVAIYGNTTSPQDTVSLYYASQSIKPY